MKQQKPQEKEEITERQIIEDAYIKKRLFWIEETPEKSFIVFMEGQKYEKFISKQSHDKQIEELKKENEKLKTDAIQEIQKRDTEINGFRQEVLKLAVEIIHLKEVIKSYPYQKSWRRSD